MAIIPADPHDALQHFCKGCICMQGKMWKNLNTSELSLVTSFSRLLLQFCLLEKEFRSSKSLTMTSWPLLADTNVGRPRFPVYLFKWKTLNNAESETRGACVYFWITNGNFLQVGSVSSKYQFCLCSISMKWFAVVICNVSEKRKSTKMQWDLCDDRDFQRKGMNEPWAQKNTILYFRKKLFAKIIEVKEAEPLKNYFHFPCDCALLAFPGVFRYQFPFFFFVFPVLQKRC